MSAVSGHFAGANVVRFAVAWWLGIFATHLGTPSPSLALFLRIANKFTPAFLVSMRNVGASLLANSSKNAIK
ncbi:MAG: hypothetical protein O3C43_13410 [Verrucomicrobia bacterium]|nr:hypothetical protein [Verrucomicrobiota bacterium]MDA1067490.1 hypothetical protein [Verrucomicrobiota bacterium]